MEQWKIKVPVVKSSLVDYADMNTFYRIFGKYRNLGVNCDNSKVLTKVSVDLVMGNVPFIGKVYGNSHWIGILKLLSKNILAKYPEFKVEHAGTLCVRNIRGSTVPSVHAYGCATDIKIGTLDQLGSNMCAKGIMEVVIPEARRLGITCGVDFSRTDAMHLQIGKTQLLRAYPL